MLVVQERKTDFFLGVTNSSRTINIVPIFGLALFLKRMMKKMGASVHAQSILFLPITLAFITWSETFGNGLRIGGQLDTML